MNKQELLFAQKAVYSAGKHLADAGMRLRETEFGKDYQKAWDALQALNRKLIDNIHKK